MIAFTLFYELSYCFVPTKIISFLGLKLTVYDYSRFREMLKNDEAVKINDWDNKRFYIVILSILLFLTFKIL